jgi:hypothetical protein
MEKSLAERKVLRKVEETAHLMVVMWENLWAALKV